MSMTKRAWSQTPLAVLNAKKSSAQSASLAAEVARSNVRGRPVKGEKPCSPRIFWIVGWL